MTELSLYNTNGLFHQVVKKSAILNGRYAPLTKGSHDLNLNNLISGLDLPPVGDKYPGVFCLPPVSELPGTVQGSNAWETFQFRLLFLCRTGYTGDNKIKSPDFNTNSSLHTVPMDWADMKVVAVNFLNALEKIQPRTRATFRLSQQTTWRIIRVSGMQNDNLSGVMVLFSASIAAPCEFTDIDISAIELPVDNHPTHFH